MEGRGAMRKIQFNWLVNRGLSNFQRLHRVCERERGKRRVKERGEGEEERVGVRQGEEKKRENRRRRRRPLESGRTNAGDTGGRKRRD